MILHVFLVALASDLATGLGALPAALVPTRSYAWKGRAEAAAAGMMLSASVFVLADQALRRGLTPLVIGGMLLGAWFFTYTERWIGHRSWRIEHLDAAGSRQALLIVLTMFVHSIPEGVAIGVGYATGEPTFGLLLAAAIAVHNIPEGTAVALPLRARGVPLGRCMAYAVLTSLPQPIMAVPAFVLASAFQPLLPVGLGFAGGAMIFLVAAELVPASLTVCSPRETAWSLMIGLTGMLALTSAMGL